MGGKFKLLKQIIPLFPEKINTFVDIFGGGFNVGINVNAEHYIYNDICKEVTELLTAIKEIPLEDNLEEIDSYIESYNLSKENTEGFLQLREDYNTQIKTPIKFYTLICYAFNNQIRFNSKGEYNMPFGKNRSSFNPGLRKKFIEFSNKLSTLDCIFFNKSFEKIDFSDFDKNDFVYCDPPYLSSVASYNEQGGWTEEHEKRLLELLDTLDSKGVKFALSNNLKYDNPLLTEWKNRYKVYHLKGDYSNCNYQKKDKSKDNEILIVNY